MKTGARRHASVGNGSEPASSELRVATRHIVTWRWGRVWPTAIELPVQAFTLGIVSVNWFEVSGRIMNLI